MRTYADMQARIANDLARSDLTSEIQLAIQDAIYDYERRRFYFNELRQAPAFTCVVGQEFYTLSADADIASMPHLDAVTLYAFNNRYTLEYMTPKQMEDISVSPYWNGMPTDYTYYNEQIRLYPIPNYAYPVYLSGTIRLSHPSASGDSGPWMNDAEQLIRACATKKLCRDVTYDQLKMSAAANAEEEALRYLLGETAQRGGPARIRATKF
jgi:hypothetical protein